MGNKRFINSDAETNLDFLNERVVNYKKKNSYRLFILVVLIAFSLGMVLFITYGYFKSYFSLPFFKNNLEKDVIKSSVDEFKEIFTIEKIEDETTNKEIADNNTINTLISPEEISKNSICVIRPNNYTGSKNRPIDDFVENGVVIKVDEKINILTYQNKVVDFDEVVVCFYNGKACIGKVVKVSDDCGIALVQVDVGKLNEEELNQIKAVDISDETELTIGKKLNFIGNTVEKNPIIKKGSLTIETNTVSIMDAQISLFLTDIKLEEENSGFLFDEKGSLYAIINKGNHLQKDSISYIIMSSIDLYMDSFLNDDLVSYLGIYGEEVIQEVINNIDSQMPFGIYISKIKSYSPAYNAGIVHGDVLVSINNMDVKNFSDYNKELKKCNVGDEVTVAVMRKGKEGYKRIEYQIAVGGLV